MTLPLYISATVLAGVPFGAVPVASAATVLSDNFGTGSSVNNIPSWEEEGSENDSTTLAFNATSGNDSASPDAGRFARIGQDEWICRMVDADGFMNLMLSYQWRGDSDAESEDDGIVEYLNSNDTDDCDNGGWTSLQNHDVTAHASWTSQSAFALPTVLWDNEFLLRFRMNSSASSEEFRVDAVNVTGDTAQICDGSFATIYVNGSTIVGGPMNGLSYNGILIGTGGNDVIVTGNGSAYVDGMAGNDKICGGNAADILNGGEGNDEIWGENANDSLYGGPGDDELWGENGSDDLYGGSGVDPLNGGSSTDSCHGGIPAGELNTNCEDNDVGVVFVTKDAVPNSAQDFAFTGSWTFTRDDDSDPTLPNTWVAARPSTGGSYTVTETAVSGWTPSASCSGGGPDTSATGGTATIGLDDGEEIFCTFTNTQTPTTGTISIQKQTLPDGNVTDFTFTGGITATLSDNESTTPLTVTPGQYTVTEGEFSDWRVTGISCSDGNSTGNVSTRTATFNVEAGENVVCTFTNTLLGKLNIIKVNNGGDGVFDFTSPQSSEVAPFSIDTNGANQHGVFVLPGTYTVNESPEAGWTMTQNLCQNVSVVAGAQTDCSITNYFVGVYECNDTVDNDEDEATDFPADEDCTSPTDDNEGAQDCGNGVTEGTETCDDGNTNDGDGCSEVCAEEEGWTCEGAPSICAQDNTCVPEDDDVLFYLPLDEVSGTTSADVTGSGYNGTHVNTPTISSDVPTLGFDNTRSLNFNGTDEYVDLGNPSFATPGAFSVSAWVKADTVGDDRQVVSKGYNGTNTEWEMKTTQPDGRMSFQTFQSGQVGVEALTPLTAGVWTHYVGTFDGTTWKIYINGDLDNSAIAAPPVATAQPIHIGAVDNQGTPVQFWDGNIDDVRFYDRALTLDEVEGLFGGECDVAPAVCGNGILESGEQCDDGEEPEDGDGCSVTCQEEEGWSCTNDPMPSVCTEDGVCAPTDENLAAYWTFNETASTTANDITTFNNVGTHTNGVISGSGPAAPVFFDNPFAASFDGVDDYTLVDDTTGLPSGSQPRTLMAWVNMDSVGYQASIISLGNGATADQRFILQVGNEPAEGPTYAFTDGINGNNNIVISGPQVPAIGGWHHVAFSFDGSGWAYYLDGTAMSSGTFATPINTVTNNVEIGSRHDSATGYFDGKLDDVRIYSVALDADDIADIAGGACEPGDVVPVTECNDGVDNDESGQTDFPADPNCSGPTDTNEGEEVVVTECNDGVDNADEEDTLVDMLDPGCESPFDESEYNVVVVLPACGDSVDNDDDGLADFGNDPGCTSAEDTNELDPPSEETGDLCVPDGLIAHWKLDEQTGVVAIDSAGNDHNGDITGGPVYLSGTPSISPNDSALRFDGSDDVVTAPSTGLDFGTTDFTLSTWIKTQTGDKSILGHFNFFGGETNVHRGYGMYVYGTGDMNAFAYGSLGKSDTYKPADLLDNEWHHIVATFTRTGDDVTINFYKDGALIGTSTGTVGDLTMPETPFLIGKYTFQPNFGPGSIDDVRVYGRALTGDEVADLSDNCAGNEDEGGGGETQSLQSQGQDDEGGTGGDHIGHRLNEWSLFTNSALFNSLDNGLPPPAFGGSPNQIPGIAPGAFGGSPDDLDGELTGPQLRVVCRLQDALARNGDLEAAVEWVASQLSPLFGMDTADIAAALRNQDLCAEHRSSRAPNEVTQKEALKPFTVMNGAPYVVGYPTFNACFSDKVVSLQDIRSNTDRTEGRRTNSLAAVLMGAKTVVNTPHGCAQYMDRMENGKILGKLPVTQDTFVYDPKTHALDAKGYEKVELSTETE